ncbi:MAG: hypothetical protein JEZ07_03385 [Phycisphaerae bacterium]|nr:hypothetical protein [Phycisphaerae bacterium]
MKSEIKFWETVILSGKKYEPITAEQEADFEIAEFFLSRNEEKKAA